MLSIRVPLLLTAEMAGSQAPREVLGLLLTASVIVLAVDYARAIRWL